MISRQAKVTFIGLVVVGFSVLLYEGLGTALYAAFMGWWTGKGYSFYWP